MVKLLIGHKGAGKTKQMIALANDQVEHSDGSIIVGSGGVRGSIVRSRGAAGSIRYGHLPNFILPQM